MEEVLSSRMIYKGHIVNLRVDTVVLPNGKQTQREIVEHPGAVAIVPQLDNGNVLLLRQFRKAAEKELLEVPAGTLATNENPRDCALRELVEETGFRAGRLARLASFYLAPGYSTELLHVYLASHLSPGARKLEEDEFIEVFSVPLDGALHWIDTGKIRDAKSIAALLLTSWKRKEAATRHRNTRTVRRRRLL